MAEGLWNNPWQLPLEPLYEEQEEIREEREAKEEEEEEEELQDGEESEESGGSVTRLEKEDVKYVKDNEQEEEVDIASMTETDWWQCHLGSVRQRMATLHHHNRLFDLVLVFPKHHVEMKVRRKAWEKGKGEG